MSGSWLAITAVVGFLASLVGVVLGDLVSGEIRGRLDRIPHTLIQRAGRRLGEEIRAEVTSEWAAELHVILDRHRGGAFPLTRLVIGARFAVGLLHAGATIDRTLSRNHRTVRKLSQALRVLNPPGPAAEAPNAETVAARLAAAGRLASEARVAEVQGEIDAARAAAGGALEPEDAVLAGTLLAVACSNADDRDRADRELAVVEPSVPRASPLRQARFYTVAAGIAQCSGDSERAITMAIRALAFLDTAEPPSPDSMVALGNCTMTLARVQLYTLSVQTGHRAIAVAPAAGLLDNRPQINTGYAYLTWAMQLEHRGLNTEAEDRWRHAATHLAAGLTRPDDLGLLFTVWAGASLALCQARLGQPGEARRELLTARAVPAVQSGESARLIAHAEAAILLAEHRHTQAADLLAACWAHTQDQHQLPWPADLAYLLGKTAEAAGNPTDAQRWQTEMRHRYTNPAAAVPPH